MKNLKKVMALLAVAAMTLSLAACGQEQTTVSSDDTAAEETTDAAETTEETTDAAEETTDTAASGDLFDLANYKSDKDESEWTIAVVTKDNTAAWFQRMEEGVNEFGEATGINVIQTGPANADAASQVQVIDDRSGRRCSLRSSDRPGRNRGFSAERNGAGNCSCNT